MGIIYRPPIAIYSVHGLENVRFPITKGIGYNWQFKTDYFPPSWTSIDLTITTTYSTIGSGSGVCNSHVDKSGVYYTGTAPCNYTNCLQQPKMQNGTYNIKVTKLPIWFAGFSNGCTGGSWNKGAIVHSCKIEFRNANQDDTRVLIWDNNLPVPNTGTLDEFINSDGSGSDVAEDFYDPTGNSTPSSPTALHRIDHYVTVKNIEDPKLDISMVINKVIWDIKTQTLYYINRNGVVNKLGPKEILF